MRGKLIVLILVIGACSDGGSAPVATTDIDSFCLHYEETRTLNRQQQVKELAKVAPSLRAQLAFEARAELRSDVDQDGLIDDLFEECDVLAGR